MAWMLPKSDDELLALAKGYPYETPGFSYLFSSETVQPLNGADQTLFRGRKPVIAHGSNRSPAQLSRKFGNWSPQESLMPVTRAWLMDYDVVYSAHITQYGAIATNLHYAPGHRIELYLNWLDEKQLEFMHLTELPSENYRYGCLADVRIEIEGSVPEAELNTAMVYLSNRGCFAPDGHPVAAAGLPGDGRAHPPKGQEEVLIAVRDLYQPDEALDDHILQTIRNPELRKQIVDQMKKCALPPQAPHFEVLKS
jgi:hypothetical protein